MRKVPVTLASVCLVSAVLIAATAPADASTPTTKSVSGSHVFYDQNVAGVQYFLKAQQSFNIKINRDAPAASVSDYASNVVIRTGNELDVTVEKLGHEVVVGKCKRVGSSHNKCTRVVLSLRGTAVTQYGTVYHQRGQLITEVSKSGRNTTWGTLGAISSK